jgi:hypothetical protein
LLLLQESVNMEKWIPEYLEEEKIFAPTEGIKMQALFELKIMRYRKER